MKILSNLVHNIYSLCKYNLHIDTNELRSNTEKELYTIRKKIFDFSESLSACRRENINLYYELHSDDAKDYTDELQYLKEHVFLDPFPYPQVKTVGSIESCMDNDLKMPYVMHKNKRLYFPQSWSVVGVRQTYRNFIERENILGGGYTAKAPHEYQTDDFKVENGDVLVDVGSAEGLLALDVIDRVSKVYIFESDPVWMAPLRATFAPYSDKVQIINKLVSDVDSECSVKLSTALKDDMQSSLFIKMDIEGYETKVVEASADFLEQAKKIKMACCTYHKNKDADFLSEKLQSLGYEFSFSDGYMLFIYDHEFKEPYFRKGIIRAKKTSL